MHLARIGITGAGVFRFLFSFASNLTHFSFPKIKMRQIRDIRQFFRFIRIISMSGEAKVGLRLLIFLRKKVYIPMILIRLHFY